MHAGITCVPKILRRDKLEFIGQLVSRRRTEFRARFTGDIPIASGGAASAAKPLVNEKNDQSPDVRSGRQKAWYQYIASLSVTPTCVGVLVSFWVVRVVPPATLTRVALHHSLWVCRPAGLKIPRAFSPTKVRSTRWEVRSESSASLAARHLLSIENTCRRSLPDFILRTSHLVPRTSAYSNLLPLQYV